FLIFTRDNGIFFVGRLATFNHQKFPRFVIVLRRRVDPDPECQRDSSNDDKSNRAMDLFHERPNKALDFPRADYRGTTVTRQDKIAPLKLENYDLTTLPGNAGIFARFLFRWCSPRCGRSWSR